MSDSPGAPRGRAILRRGIIALVLLAPLPFGAVHDWAVFTLELAAVALGVLTLIVAWYDPPRWPRRES